MYIKLVNNIIMKCVKSPVIKDNILYLYFGDPYTAENLYTVFNNKENLTQIKTYSTDQADSYYGSFYGFTVLGGSSIINGEKVITLTSETDADSVRITQALSNSVQANTISEELSKKLDQINANLECIAIVNDIQIQEV